MGAFCAAFVLPAWFIEYIGVPTHVFMGVLLKWLTYFAFCNLKRSLFGFILSLLKTPQEFTFLLVLTNIQFLQRLKGNLFQILLLLFKKILTLLAIDLFLSKTRMLLIAFLLLQKIQINRQSDLILLLSFLLCVWLPELIGFCFQNFTLEPK